MNQPKPAAKPTAATTPTQLQLFQMEPEAPPAKWTGHRGPWGKNLSWTHANLPGLTVRHCGHPTAIRPYYFTTGGDVSPANGTTYMHLATCQAAAAAWHETTRYHAATA